MVYHVLKNHRNKDVTDLENVFLTYALFFPAIHLFSLTTKCQFQALKRKNYDRVPKTEYLPVNFLQFIDIDEMCGGKGEEVALHLLKADILENLFPT